jgi:tRNA U34 5-methylaminomethyl-2-thiouridine-forming methyltransferase MnmC
LNKEIISKDGSYTLYSKQYNEHYHSINDGAFTESLQKHIKPAFNHIKKLNLKTINILDICFGLGYNTLTSIYYMQKEKLDIKLNIYSPELDKDLVSSLKNYTYPKEFDNLKNIIISLSDNYQYKNDYIKINIEIIDACEYYKKINVPIDIIYQDAFSLKKNPALWTKEFFASLKKISSKNVILTTYTKTSEVRKALNENGFLLYEYRGENVRKSILGFLKEDTQRVLI